MTIDKFNFAGKKAIVRVDFNVPLDENGKITDDTRIRGALPTLKKVLADGGSLIIMSHMGKPKGKVNAKYSLSQIVDAVSEKLGVPVQFAPDCAKAGDAAAALKPGEVLLLENLRFYPEEEGKPVGIDKEDPAYEDAKKAMKASQKEFAKTLASYADCYINDAFGTAHRKHASTAVIADYFDADNKMLGYLMEKEVQAVDNILKDIKRPFTAIMGGSKVSTKIGIIENLMDKVDNLILCGGMTYTFAKAQGGKIGNSIVEDDKLDLALDIIAKAKAKGVNLVLGSDCVAADAFSNDAHTQVVPANNIPDGWEGLDAGPETQKAFAAAIEDAKTILWNGPAGVFEFDNFTAGSRAIAEAIAKATKNGAPYTDIDHGKLCTIGQVFRTQLNSLLHIIQCTLELFGLQGSLLTIIIEHIIHLAVYRFIISIVIKHGGTRLIRVHAGLGTFQQVRSGFFRVRFGETYHTTVHKCQHFFRRRFHQFLCLGCTEKRCCRRYIGLINLFVACQSCRIILLCKQNIPFSLYIHRKFLNGNRFSYFIHSLIVRPVLIGLFRITQHIIVYQFGTVVIYVVFLLSHTQGFIHIRHDLIHRGIDRKSVV